MSRKLPSRPGEFHPESLTGRVGDWRAGLGRSLCSLLPRPFGCEVSQHLDQSHVSSPRHVERSVWISLTTLTCLLRHQGLWDLSCGGDFLQRPPNPVAIEQLQGLVEPLPTPPRPAEAL